MKFMVTPDIDDAKKSQLADTVIAGRGRARQGKRERKKESRKKANYCRIVKELKTRNEPCGAVFNVSRYRDEINNIQIGGGNVSEGNRRAGRCDTRGSCREKRRSINKSMKLTKANDRASKACVHARACDLAKRDRFRCVVCRGIAESAGVHEDASKLSARR